MTPTLSILKPSHKVPVRINLLTYVQTMEDDMNQGNIYSTTKSPTQLSSSLDNIRQTTQPMPKQMYQTWIDISKRKNDSSNTTVQHHNVP